MPFNSNSVPPKLIEEIQEKRCILFAGAGLSQDAVTSQGTHLPGWKELLERMLEYGIQRRYIPADEESKIQKLISEKKYLLVGEEFREHLWGGRLEGFLREQLRYSSPCPTENHRLIVHIPFSAIFTTNYDKLLETAFAQETGQLPSIYTYKSIFSLVESLWKNQFYILKLHGDVDEQDSIIFSRIDYRKIIYRELGFRLFCNSVFTSKTILFMGYSMSDPDIILFLEYIHDALQGYGDKRHFILRPDDEVSDIEVKRWEKDFGVKTITYAKNNGHPEVTEFLKWLRGQTSV
jgi:hypothetical protein